MDMDQAFDLGPAKRGRRDPHAPLKSGLDYLRRVADERETHASVVVVELPQDVKPNNLRIADFKRVTGVNAEGVTFPDRSWYDDKVTAFTTLREKLVRLREEAKANDELPAFILPECEDQRGWRLLCLRKWTSQIPADKLTPDMMDKLTKEHSGTPPLLKLVLALPEHTVHALLGYQIEWLLSSYEVKKRKRAGGKRKLSGHSMSDNEPVPNTSSESATAKETTSNTEINQERSRTSSIASTTSTSTTGDDGGNYEIPKNYSHWIFALLAVLEKPFDSDTTSALRDLARFCAARRAEIKTADDPLIYVYSWFIGIVAVYFEQRDLLDEFGII